MGYNPMDLVYKRIAELQDSISTVAIKLGETSPRPDPPNPVKVKPKDYKCKSCGAPLNMTLDKCEYCGTYFRDPKSANTVTWPTKALQENDTAIYQLGKKEPVGYLSSGTLERFYMGKWVGDPKLRQTVML